MYHNLSILLYPIRQQRFEFRVGASATVQSIAQTALLAHYWRGRNVHSRCDRWLCRVTSISGLHFHSRNTLSHASLSTHMLSSHKHAEAIFGLTPLIEVRSVTHHVAFSLMYRS